MLLTLALRTGLFVALVAARYEHVCLDEDAVVSRHNPPHGSLVVSKNPQEHEFGTIQAAIDALKVVDSQQKRIFVRPGVYEEQVRLEDFNVSIFGETANLCDYAQNTVTIVASRAVQAKGDDLLGTSTVIINGPGINLYNLNIRNDGGVKSQAIALTSSGDNQAVYACQLLGEQDTFYADRGSILVTHSLITGVTDFIFGQDSVQIIHSSDVYIPKTNRSYAHITAPGRYKPESPGIIVLDDVTITVDAGYKPGRVDFGRLWQHYGQAHFQDITFFGDMDAWNPKGFIPFHKNEPEDSLAESTLTYLHFVRGPDSTQFSPYFKLGYYHTLESLLGDKFPALYDNKFL